MDSPAITAIGLRKVFRVFDRRPGFLGAMRDLVDRRWRELTAVDGIDLVIPRGQSIGYIGPNGAGKSTTIKMLTGILRPTAGSISVDGLDPFRERSRYVRRVGAVFGQRTQLWWDLAVRESLELLRRLYDVPVADFNARLKIFDQVLGLGEFLATPVRKLSLGQRMKADLAASLLHQPAVLFLDEPTVGVDVVTKEALRVFLRQLNREQGTTIILTTHDMQDIEHLCDRVVVIDHGRLIHDGSIGDLKDRYGGRKRLLLTLGEARRLEGLALPSDGITWSQPSPVQLSAEFAAAGTSVAVLLQDLLSRLPVADVQLNEPGIEAVVKAILAQR